ncbi:glycosyltransferase [uncultured Thiodictyon sp.]|uniref:glycosyltransferase n=1 Tax=uncultured Thiodictyon sp. TaxID=1846217 RepID=UPI0025CF27DD|nr:glycosyltransferase [uncultured Thiodictyon sp.]
MSLTIVFSTRVLDRAFVEHVQSTVGVPGTQIIPYVNSNAFSLASLYNRGLEAAENDIVVFLHDDIVFDKTGWGVRLLKQFRETEFGILGVAGTTELIRDREGIVERWWRVENKRVGWVRHLVDGRHRDALLSYKYRRPVEVICLDGVFIAVDKRRIREKFDERFFGFHFYDISFTFRNHLLGVKVGVAFDVDVTHKSVGVLSDEWNRGRKQFTHLYGEHIPYEIQRVTGRVRYFDFGNARRYLGAWYEKHLSWRFKSLK